MQSCLITPTRNGSLALGSSAQEFLGRFRVFFCFFPHSPWNPLQLFPPQQSQSKVWESDPHKPSMTQFPRQLFPDLPQSSGCFEPGGLKQDSKGKDGFSHPSLGDRCELCGDREVHKARREDTDLWMPVLSVVPLRSFRGIS